MKGGESLRIFGTLQSWHAHANNMASEAAAAEAPKVAVVNKGMEEVVGSSLPRGGTVRQIGHV